VSSDVERRLRDVPAEFPRPDETAMRELERRVLSLWPRRRRRRRVGPGVVAAIAAALAAGVVIGHWTAPASAVEAATFRSIDVTMLCTTVTQFGIREVSVGAVPRIVTPTWDRPASVHAWTGSAGATESLAGAEARGQSGRPRGGVFLHRVRCSATRAQIPLSARGLPGPPTLHQRSFDCGATRRVIVRVRATLKTPGPWEILGERRELRGIRRDVTSAAIAVRTWPGKKPLGFTLFDAREQTKLWIASGCS
jgi:hypothetical protein